MIEVICIKDFGPHIVKGKHYLSRKMDITKTPLYAISDMDNRSICALREYNYTLSFQSLEEYRNNNINKILI